jgi:monoamine oxidase
VEPHAQPLTIEPPIHYSQSAFFVSLPQTHSTQPIADVAIIGGGLSGLYAAHLLTQRELRYALFEARPETGGRLLSVSVEAITSEGKRNVTSREPTDRFDLGATWFWPAQQPQLGALVSSLGLETFAQLDAGDWVIERSPLAPPQRMRGPASSPPSMRVVGGMASLVQAVQQRLDSSCLHLSHQVTAVTLHEKSVEVETLVNGVPTPWHAGRLLLALPPRLAAESIRFHPALPPEVSRAWLNTPTWMAPHAKYLAVFDEPFWRADGLAGTAQSAVGPMVEVQDASSPGGHAALFGFIGVPAQARAGIDRNDMLAGCRAQLVRLFGERAARPVAETLLDWAQEPFTATAQDHIASGHHATAPVASVSRSPWEGHVFGIASEWSPEFPGYIAGAVDAAQRAVDALGRALKAKSAAT